MEEAQLIVSKTATFHAVCAVLQEQNPNIFDNFEHGNFKEKIWISSKS